MEGTWRRRKGGTRVTRERKIVAGRGGEIRSIREASHAERQAEAVEEEGEDRRKRNGGNKTRGGEKEEAAERGREETSEEARTRRGARRARGPPLLLERVSNARARAADHYT